MQPHPGLGLVVAVIWFAVGLFCMRRPQWFQQRAMRSVEGWPWQPFSWFASHPSYVPTVRLMGTVCIASALFLAVVCLIELSRG